MTSLDTALEAHLDVGEYGDDSPHIAVVGELVHGFVFYGPFDSYDAAYAWTEKVGFYVDVHIIPLTFPFEVEQEEDELPF